MRKNELIELSIESVSNEGNGVGRHEGVAVFVPNTAVGDRILCRIVRVQKGYCYGIMEQLLTPSPDRRESGCAAFGRCGGCTLRHLSYQKELEVKNGWVRENLRRIGKIELELPPALPSPLELRYRNKAIYPVQRADDGSIRIGFYAKRSHRVVEQPDCLLHPVCFSALTEAFRGWLTEENVSVYDENTHRGLVRALFLRHAEATGEVPTARC